MSGEEDLGRRLREANEAELYDLLASHLDELDPGEVGQALRNPYASARVLDLVAARRPTLRAYEVRRALVAHPRTPAPRSLNLVGTLYWRDLVKIGADTRIPPRVRRAADHRLAQRLPALALGERVAIARSAGPGLIERLRTDPEPRVVAALLENPRLTEALLAPLLTDTMTAPAVLSRVAADRKWGRRYVVCHAIAANPSTPETTALDLLPGLKKRDLASIAADRRLPELVRRRADLLRGAGIPVVDRGEVGN